MPASRPLTVEDLLTFRCGLGLVLAPPGRYPIQKAIADLGVFGPPDAAMPLDGDAWMRKIGSLPLFVQPGSTIHGHFHPEEDVYEVIAGELEMAVDGVTDIVRPGIVAIVPSNARPH